MSPRNVYQDDDALTSFLDNLIESGKENDAPDPSISAEQLPPTDPNLAFTSSQLHKGIELANQLLREGGQCSPLPSLSEKNGNIEDVLAAAVTAIVRLSRCCKANANLRAEAEHTAQGSEAKIEELSGVLRATREKLEKKESSLVAVRNKMAELDVKTKSKIRQLTAEGNTMKSRLTTAAHRENHLTLEASQRERQYSQLQRRVHALMSNTKKLSIEPIITGTGTQLRGLKPRPVAQLSSNEPGAPGTSSDHDLDSHDEEELALRLTDENHFMRNTIRVIHVELDDMFDSHPKAFHFLHHPEAEGSEEADKEKDNGMPPPAPSEERMLLPYEMIRDEFEANLERKLDIVRKAIGALE